MTLKISFNIFKCIKLKKNGQNHHKVLDTLLFSFNIFGISLKFVLCSGNQQDLRNKLNVVDKRNLKSTKRDNACLNFHSSLKEIIRNLKHAPTFLPLINNCQTKYSRAT